MTTVEVTTNIQDTEVNKNVVEKIDAQYYQAMEKVEKSKCQIIKEYAADLEKKGKVPLNQICKHISEKLKNFVTDRWVRKCLEGENGEVNKYKDAIKSNEGKQQKGHGRGSGSATIGKNNTQAQTAEITTDTESENIGRENTKKNNPIDFDSYFKLIDTDGTEYSINTKKLKDVPTDVKDKMIGQLIGGMEFLQGELEESLKQVESLRKENKALEKELKAKPKTKSKSKNAIPEMVDEKEKADMVRDLMDMEGL